MVVGSNYNADHSNITMTVYYIIYYELCTKKYGALCTSDEFIGLLIDRSERGLKSNRKKKAINSNRFETSDPITVFTINVIVEKHSYTI